jgi:hypothetical protein
MAVAQLRLLQIEGARCLSQKTHLRVMKFPNSRTFFLIESCGPLRVGVRGKVMALHKKGLSQACGRAQGVFTPEAPAKRGPSFGRKAGAQAPQ